MNKPAKILIAVTLLAFAAAGFYYAWMAPAKKPGAGGSAPLVVRRDPGVPKVPAETAGRDLREAGTMDRAAMPTPVPATPAMPAAPAMPTAPAGPAPASGNPEGFRPSSAPAGTLPNRLDGFETTPAGDSGMAPARTTTPPAAPSTAGGGAGATPSTPPVPPAGSGTPVRPPVASPPKPAPPSKPSETTYTVKPGDSLAGIWKQLTGSERGWEKLQAANPGLDPTRLKIGQVLKVPAFEAAAPTTPAAPVTAGPGEHVVKEGDTLSSIAADKLGAAKRWKEIYDANKATIGPDPAALKLGMKLVIPGGVAKPTTPPATTRPATTPPASPPVTVPPALPPLPPPSAPSGGSVPPAPGSTGVPPSPGSGSTPPPAPRST